MSIKVIVAAGAVTLFLITYCWFAVNSGITEDSHLKTSRLLDKIAKRYSPQPEVEFETIAKKDGVQSFLHQSRRKVFQRFGMDRLRQQGTDPEIKMNASQLITSKGLPCEEHFPITSDGYILGMQRIPQPSSNKLPVLLLHGLLSSSDCFLTNLINESLAYILYKEGYDVWLGNVRGNRYSRRHLTLSPDNIKFWHWTFDEMGMYDVPAMVDYILKVTQHEKINYIAHSQGNTCLLTAAMSNGNDFSNKINSFIALAPAGLVSHATSPLHYLVYIAHDIELVYWLFGYGEFLPHSSLSPIIAKFACQEEEKYCENIYFLIGGTDFHNTNMSRLPVYSAHNPAGTSTWNMLHWAQMLDTKGDVLNHYDYGHWYLNLLHYGQASPPSYNFTKFTIPTYAFCGENDTLVVPADCDHLINKLTTVKHFELVPSYTHLDFIYAVNSPTVLYNKVIKILQKV